MPVISEDIWNILYTVSRYLFPLLALILVILILFYILSEGRLRREKVRSLPGCGTVGELIVLSGCRDLDVNTWFPVPREGVLGSVRSCDLVIPCPGVHTKHLDFSWRDGLGLLIRPRTGCEALINGMPVTCRTNAADVPLQHGSILQIGSAVLRLHLFAALDNTAAPDDPPVPESFQPAVEFLPPYPSAPVFVPAPPGTYSAGWDDAEQPAQMPFMPVQPAPGTQPLPEPVPVQELVEPTVPVSPERTTSRRSDRWKEDFGE